MSQIKKYKAASTRELTPSKKQVNQKNNIEKGKYNHPKKKKKRVTIHIGGNLFNLKISY